MEKPWNDDFNPFLTSPLTVRLLATNEYVSVFRAISTLDGVVLLYTDDRGDKGACLYPAVSVMDHARYRQLLFFCHVSEMEWDRICLGSEVYAANERVLIEND